MGPRALEPETLKATLRSKPQTSSYILSTLSGPILLAQHQVAAAPYLRPGDEGHGLGARALKIVAVFLPVTLPAFRSRMLCLAVFFGPSVSSVEPRDLQSLFGAPQ